MATEYWCVKRVDEDGTFWLSKHSLHWKRERSPNCEMTKEEAEEHAGDRLERSTIKVVHVTRYSLEETRTRRRVTLEALEMFKESTATLDVERLALANELDRMKQTATFLYAKLLCTSERIEAKDLIGARDAVEVSTDEAAWITRRGLASTMQELVGPTMKALIQDPFNLPQDGAEQLPLPLPADAAVFVVGGEICGKDSAGVTREPYETSDARDRVGDPPGGR